MRSANHRDANELVVFEPNSVVYFRPLFRIRIQIRFGNAVDLLHLPAAIFHAPNDRKTVEGSAEQSWWRFDALHLVELDRTNITRVHVELGDLVDSARTARLEQSCKFGKKVI